MLAVLLALYAIVAGVSGHTVAGWTSTVLIVSSVGAAQLLCLGLLGEYIGRMYTQMQGRPTYFIAYDSPIATKGRHGRRTPRCRRTHGSSRAPTGGRPHPRQPLRAGGVHTGTRRHDRRPDRACADGAAAVATARTVRAPASAARVRRDQEAHAGELLDR